MSSTVVMFEDDGVFVKTQSSSMLVGWDDRAAVNR